MKHSDAILFHLSFKLNTGLMLKIVQALPACDKSASVMYAGDSTHCLVKNQ